MSKAVTEIRRDLDHSRAAYRYAVQSLPNPKELDGGEIVKGSFVFKEQSEIESMLIELGWAFFVRYEGCLEFYITKRNGIKLSTQCNLQKWLEGKGVEIPEMYTIGLENYRKIRNKLHHENGASLDSKKDGEIHLLPNHMENFYKLFVWCGMKIDEVVNRQALKGS